MLKTTPSPRELVVLQFTAWGYTNKEIGAYLQISIKTVEAHKSNGMRKLKLQSRAELVRYAVEQGWLASGVSPVHQRTTQASDSRP